MSSTRTDLRRKSSAPAPRPRAMRQLAPDPLELRLLGGLELRDAQGARVALTSRKAEALLGLLALRPGEPFERFKLCALLWPDVPEAQARHSLRQTLVYLRKALPEAASALLHADARSLGLDASRVSVDAAQLLQLLALTIVVQGEQHGMRALGAVARAELAEAQLRAGAPEQAESSARAALELADSTGDVTTRGAALRVLGQSLGASGRLAEARAYLREALALQEACGAPLRLAETLVALAQSAAPLSSPRVGPGGGLGVPPNW